MLYLLLAVVTASVLGSLHCVGMCGPLAILASGAGTAAPRSKVILSTTMYHLGRLTTYTIAGGIAGYLGSLVDVGGQWIGWQVTAARTAGVMMIVIGLTKLASHFYVRKTNPAANPSRIAGVLVRLRPFLARRSPLARAFGIGFFTTFLPCGWLYLFALVAAGTSSPIMGALVMVSFWIGTVPALTSLIAGTGWLSRRSTSLVPIATAVLLVMTGGFTASGRGFANLNSLDSLRPVSTKTADLVLQVENSDEVLLPCCRAGLEAKK
jgi:uncharacterized protein